MDSQEMRKTALEQAVKYHAKGHPQFGYPVGEEKILKTADIFYKYIATRELNQQESKRETCQNVQSPPIFCCSIQGCITPRQCP